MNDSSGKNARGIFSVAVLSGAAALAGAQWTTAGTDASQQDAQGSTYQKSGPVSQSPEATQPRPMSGAESTAPQSGMQSESATTAQQGAGSESQLHNMNADEIIGKTVVTADGTELGEVDTLAKDITGGDTVYAVVTAGGVLGVGGEKVVIDLKDLTLEDDQLQTSSIQSEEQLKQQPQYNEEQYVKIEQTDRPISEFSRFEPMTEQKEQQ